MQLTKTQNQYALSLIRRFGGVAIEHIVSVLEHNDENSWPEIMHLLKNQTKPEWFAQ
jgi:hypothetical protein